MATSVCSRGSLRLCLLASQESGLQEVDKPEVGDVWAIKGGGTEADEIEPL